MRDGDLSAKENLRGVRGKQETVMYENPVKGLELRNRHGQCKRWKSKRSGGNIGDEGDVNHTPRK